MGSLNLLGICRDHVRICNHAVSCCRLRRVSFGIGNNGGDIEPCLD